MDRTLRFLPVKCLTERFQQSFSRQACPEPFLCQDKLRRRDTPELKSEFRISKPKTISKSKILKQRL